MTLFASSLVFSHLSATLLKHNRRRKQCHTQPCFIAFYSFQQVLLRAEHWPPKQTKRRKRYFGLDLRVLPMGLPNFYR